MIEPRKKTGIQGAFSAPTANAERTPASAFNHVQGKRTDIQASFADHAKTTTRTVGAHAPGDVHPPVGKHNEIGKKKMHRLSKTKRVTHKTRTHLKGKAHDPKYHPPGAKPAAPPSDVKRGKLRNKR